MNKSDLVALIAQQNRDLHPRDANRIVDAIFEIVTAALARGDTVDLKGFGKFVAVERPTKKFRDAKTGRLEQLPNRRFVAFTPHSRLTERVQIGGGDDEDEDDGWGGPRIR